MTKPSICEQCGKRGRVYFCTDAANPNVKSYSIYQCRSGHQWPRVPKPRASGWKLLKAEIAQLRAKVTELEGRAALEVTLPKGVAERAVSALSYRWNTVMSDPNTHGKDGLAEVLMAGASNDKIAMDAIKKALEGAQG